jgi:Fe-S-cluster containining protein
MNFNCTGCGLCCTIVGKRIKDAKQGIGNEPERTLVANFPFPVNEDGSCSKYDHATKKCSDYENRPLICNVERLFYKFHSSPGHRLAVSEQDEIKVPKLKNSKGQENLHYEEQKEAYIKAVKKQIDQGKAVYIEVKNTRPKSMYFDAIAIGCNLIMKEAGLSKDNYVMAHK